VEERESRLLLMRFLVITDKVLDRFLHEMARLRAVAQTQFQQLNMIWRTARESLSRTIQSLEIGLSLARRTALHQVGMFGESLAAKFSLLEFDLQAGAIKRALKRVNSMLGSMAKVFPSLHAVKELKDHAEATHEGMKQPLEFISLKDLLEQP
jgi:hypothetical protein